MDYSSCFQEYTKNGFAVLKDFLTPSDVEKLREECQNIIEKSKDPKELHAPRHQGGDDTHLLTSSDKISFFFEKEAIDGPDKLKFDKKQSISRIGHALHWVNPIIKEITFSDKLKKLVRCFEYKNPIVVQSMMIMKNPYIGGAANPHQDSTYLYTEPPTSLGIWLPLDDVTLENGCLWFVPGSHNDRIYQRFVRNPEEGPILIYRGDQHEYEDGQYVPVLVNKGDCVIIHGSVFHKSEKNLSDKPRLVYTYHVVESEGAIYSKENWLQTTEQMPNFPAVYAV